MQPRTTLRVGLLRGPESLDPRVAAHATELWTLSPIVETPYAQPSGNGPPTPLVLAEPLRVERANGTMVCSAPVRRGSRFADGRPMAPEDVLAALAGSRSLASQAEVTLDGDRIRFELVNSNARFDQELTQIFCGIVRQNGEGLVGSGPYRVAPGSSPGHLRLERNPHARQPPAIDTIDFLVFPPEADGRPRALIDAINGGEIDLALDLCREDLKGLRGVNKWFEPGSSTAILYLNCQRPALGDRNVRRAVALALDRATLAGLTYANPSAFVASSLLPPVIGRYRDGLKHDPERARGLLREAKIKPQRLKMTVVWGRRPYLPDPAPMAELIAEQLGRIGLEVDVAATASAAEFVAAKEAGDYDLALSGWIPDTLDPATYLEAVLSTSGMPEADRSPWNRANLSRWSDPATDRAIATLRAEPSKERLETVLDRVSDEVPLVPILHGPTILAHSFRVRNVRLSPLGFPLFAKMQLSR